jgi:hypothetical protein
MMIHLQVNQKIQLFCSERWSKYASTVDAGYQDLLDWIKTDFKAILIIITFWQDGACH